MSRPEKSSDPARSARIRTAKRWVRWTYQALFVIGLLGSAPVWLTRLIRRGNWREGFGQRLGFYPRGIAGRVEGRPVLWLHAVSVGEVNLALLVAGQLRKRLREFTLVMSTTTNTGMEQLRRRLPPGVVPVYYPFDLAGAVRRAFRTLRPRAVVLVEAEIWPNFLWAAMDRQVRLVAVNAQVSPRSASRYRRFRFVFGPLFAGFDHVCCTSHEQEDRLRSIGCRPAALLRVGHLKYETALAHRGSKDEICQAVHSLRLPRDTLFLVAGSTHAGEEALLASVYSRLKRDHPSLFLIVAPRHFERSAEVAQTVERLGVKTILRTSLGSGQPVPADPPHCLVINTTGELRHWYELADVVIIGGSFSPRGGQNPLEPAVAGKPIITGPDMRDFAEIMADFRRADAVLSADDESTLESHLRSLLQDSGRRQELGRRAREVVDENQGALERTVEIIVEAASDRRPTR